MKPKAGIFLKILFLAAFLSAMITSEASNLRFVIVLYDNVTYDPIPSKQVDFQIAQTNPYQSVYQQTFTSNPNGEVVTPHIALADSTWHQVRFSIIDCNNDTLQWNHPLWVVSSDTIFLYAGICHAVSPGNCIAGFIPVFDTLNPLKVSFQNTSTGNPTTYFWSFGDGTSSVQQQPVKQYNAPGVYLVCLTISDSSTACLHTWCQVVSLNQGALVQAAFHYELDSFALAPRLVRFNNASQSNIPLNQYQWDFGDGSGSFLSNPVHQYQQSGQYTVCLRAGISGGPSDTVCIQVTIPGYHNLWGQAFTGNTTLNTGTVRLYNPSRPGVPLLDEVPVGAFGLYYFAQRIEHHYLLRVMPDRFDPASRDFLPGYSGNGIFWKEAAEVALTGDVENYDIHLVKRKSIAAGTCAVKGSVQKNAGQYVPGAVVILLDAAGHEPVAYTCADSAGGYVLDQLPFGSYLLLADEPGLDCNPVPVDLTQQNPVVNGLDIWLTQSTGIEIPSALLTFGLHPNPAGSYIRISLPSLLSGADVLIHSTDGKQLLRTHYDDLVGGEITLDIASLPEGVYVVTLLCDDRVARKKFVRAGQ